MIYNYFINVCVTKKDVRHKVMDKKKYDVQKDQYQTIIRII